MLFNLFRRKLRKRILILCALPLDRSAAKTSFQNRKSDFLDSIADSYGVPDFDAIWTAYQDSEKLLTKLLNSYESAGATVIRDFSVADLGVMTDYDAVVLMAHHVRGRDAIELRGEPVETRSIVDAIPPHFSGVLDMSSCYSSSFQLEVKLHAPKCRTIAAETGISLRVRLAIYDLLLKSLKNSDEGYLDQFRSVVQSLIESSKTTESSVAPNDSRIHLGGSHRSTVYAPKSALKGETFLVQLFLHATEDGEDVELQARMVDDSASKRNSKPLTIRLKEGDKIDVSLCAKNKQENAFDISPARQSTVWTEEPASVEFSVFVSAECIQTAFIGMIMLSVNKEPAGTLMFRTNIVSETTSVFSDCADFAMIPYDKAAEMRSERSSLMDNLQQRLELLSKQHPGGECWQKEKDMCEHCLQLLSKTSVRSINGIPRVFISSTSDMLPFRRIVEERVKACEMFPDMYELWGQGDEYPRDICCKHVLQSDFFVCILGEKYGFVEPIWNRSMTEIEYRVAKSAGIPILIYIQDNTPDNTDARQKDFRTEVKHERMVGVFSDTMSLAIMVNSELLTLKNKKL